MSIFQKSTVTYGPGAAAYPYVPGKTRISHAGKQADITSNSMSDLTGSKMPTAPNVAPNTPMPRRRLDGPQFPGFAPQVEYPQSTNKHQKSYLPKNPTTPQRVSENKWSPKVTPTVDDSAPLLGGPGHNYNTPTKGGMRFGRDHREIMPSSVPDTHKKDKSNDPASEPTNPVSVLLTVGKKNKYIVLAISAAIIIYFIRK